MYDYRWFRRRTARRPHLALRSDLAPERVELAGQARGAFSVVAQYRNNATAVKDSLSAVLHRVDEQGSDVLRALAPHEAGTFAFPVGTGSRELPAGCEPSDFLPGLAETRDIADAFLAATPGSLREYVAMLLRSGALEPGEHRWLTQDHPTVQDDPTFWTMLPNQRQMVAFYWQECDRTTRDLANRVRSFKARLLPRSVWVLIGLLGTALIVGVIVPLGFLDADCEAAKVTLLGAFSVLALGSMAYIGWEFNQLRHALRLDRDF
jgi:hypothetical protein